MKKLKRIIFFNQVTGPLFQELVLEISKYYLNGSLLITGSLDEPLTSKKVNIEIAPKYNRKNIFTKFISWLKYTQYSLGVILEARKDDLILISSNPPILGLIIFPILKFRNLTYILLIYDIYPEVLIKAGLFNSNNLFVNLWNNLNKILFNNAELVITLTDKMKENISSKYPLKKIGVVSPWVDTNKIKPIKYEDNKFATSFVEEGKFVVMYSGNMGLSHDIDTILDTALLLKNESNIFFLFIGHGPGYKKIKNFLKKNALKNIGLHPFQPKSKIKYTLPLASLSIVSVKSGFDDLLIPSKTFYYLAAGSALITISKKNSELSKLVEKHKVGIAILPGDSDGLASNIKKLMQDKRKINLMQANARELALNSFSRKESIKNVLNLFKDSKLISNI